MGHKEQPAGFPGVLLAKTLIVQGGDHRLAGAGGSHHQVAGIAPDRALRLQLVQNLLLVGVGRNIHGVHFDVVGAKVFFRFQRPGQPLLLILGVVLKFVGVPVALEGGGDLVNGLRQIPPGDLHIPLQAAGDSGIGQVGGTHIGGGEAGIPVKDIGLGVEAGAFGIVADLDFGVGQLAQLLDGLHVGGPHVGGGDDPQLPSVLGELPQLVHQEPQAAPLDEGYQHVDAVGGDDFLFELRVHLGLMDSPGEQTALGDGGLRPTQIGSCFADCQPGILLP